jgi:hypothetical protein
MRWEDDEPNEVVMTLMRSIALSAGLLLFGAHQAAQAAPSQDWTEYRNDKFGFSLEYPAGVFVVERTAEAGDGQVFVARDANARLLVGALVNDSGFTPGTYQDYIARRSYGEYQISYRRLGGYWFVLSGERQGTIFYEKVIFSCGGRVINSFAMIYPAERRDVFDPIVEQVEKTFRPGRDCESAGLPAAPVLRHSRLVPEGSTLFACESRDARSSGPSLKLVGGTT